MDLLYLSRDAVATAAPNPAELLAAVERAFAARAAGTARLGPKVNLPIATGHFFQTLLGALDAPAYAGMKWLGVIPDNAARGLPNVSSLIVLDDIVTGLPLAIMDANWITAARTAAMTALAARCLASPLATHAAFIGCGAQARGHAVMLRQVLPQLQQAALLGRRAESRDAFAGLLRDQGWTVRVAAGPEDALDGADIVVSTVPEYPGWEPFLDAARLVPGAFAASVDLGRSWLPASYGAFDIVATDDAEQSRVFVAQGKLKAPDRFEADLAALVTGAHPGRRAGAERAMFVFAGHVLGDLAAAIAVYQRARAQGIGIRLPR